jgi:predicted  nucleic acid-binding Zn-ribbon protein
MKKLVLGMIGLGLVSSNLFALNTADIEAQIQQIQTLPAQQRVEKMNELKEQLKTMNEQDREKAILAIQQTKEKLEAQKAQMEGKLNDGVNQMSAQQTQMSEKLQNGVTQMKEQQTQMGEKLQANKPEMEHNIPEVEHDMPEMEHNMPEVEHDMPEVDHDTPEVNR